MKNFYAVLFGLAIVIVFIGFFELFIRMVHPEIKPLLTNRDLIQINAYYDSNGLKPSSEGMSHGELIKTDKMGFRLTSAKSDTSLSSWLYLGDSVTMGIGVSTDHTFAYLSDKRIKKIKIRNAGVIGHSTHDYVNAARNFSQKMDVSKITIFYCLNDVYSIYKEQAIPGAQVREIGGGALNFIKSNFRLYDVLKTNLFDRPASYFEFVNQYYAEDNPIYLSAMNDIRTIIKFCENKNIELDIVLIPYEYQLRKYQEDSIFEPQQLIRHNLRSENISVYDCSDFFIKRGYNSKDLYLYGDGIHFSEYGHQLMQEFIFDVVLAESDLKNII
jgi:lysophospholipase L1-like esterase